MFDPASAFQEELLNNEESPKKDWKNRLLLLWQNASLTAVCLCLLVFLTILPLLFDFCAVKWYAKVLMLLGSWCALVFLMVLPAAFSEATKTNKWLLYFSPLFLAFIIGFLAYFDFELWGNKNIAIGIIFIWSLFVGFYAIVKSLFNKALGNENIPAVLVAIAMLMIFIAVIIEKNNNVDYVVCYKISVGIFYLIAIALYANKYIYRNKNEQNVMSNIIGIIFWCALITISFPFYVKWCIQLTSENFEAFVSVYAALLGGGITLAGVAWTIRDSNDKRREDLKRIENERIESEIKKARPLFSVAPVVEFPDDDSISCWADPKSYKVGEYLAVAKIVNSDNSNFYIKEIFAEGCWCTVNGATHVLKNKEITICFYRNNNGENPNSILKIEDVMGNFYYYKLKYSGKAMGFYDATSVEEIPKNELLE